MRNIDKFSIIFFLSVLVLSLVGCKDKPKPVSNETDFEKSLTNEDSVEVTRQVNNFFDLVKLRNYDDAVASLYKDYTDSDAEPRPMNNVEMAQMKRILNAVPIVNYHIDYVKFLESNDNEVKVTCDLTEGTPGKPALTTVFYFKPAKVMNTWKLCVVDSHNGDFNIINGDKRDSMQNRYAKELRDKEQAEEVKDKK